MHELFRRSAYFRIFVEYISQILPEGDLESIFIAVILGRLISARVITHIQMQKNLYMHLSAVCFKTSSQVIYVQLYCAIILQPYCNTQSSILL